MERQAEIYIHIPFCVKKCAYCDFLSAPATEEVQQQYVNRLIEEISTSKWAGKGISVPTVFIGGGTPSILPGEDIARIMEALKVFFTIEEDAEITIECNPGTLTAQKLQTYKRAGINRISIGLQSANDKELQLLGRIHTYEEFVESYTLVRQAGFSNINIDLMSALPGQTLETYQETVRRVCRLEPEHVSAYSLIIEEGTPFADTYMEDEQLRQKGEAPKQLPSEEMERQMYEWTKEYLATQGYERYEISNYSKKGYSCRHNIGYWERFPYIAYGLGASALMDECRCQNEGNLAEYLNGNYSGEVSALSRQEQMEEFMFLGLRLTKGISPECFYKNFGVELHTIYGEVLNNLIKDKLMEEYLDDKGKVYIRLTDYGLDVSNYVLAQFLLDM